MVDLPSIDEVRGLVEAGLRTAAPGGRDRALLLVDDGFLRLQREYRHDAETAAVVAEAVSAAEALDDADLLSAAFDLSGAGQMYLGHHGESRRIALKRTELVPRLSDVKEIGDTYAMAAWGAHLVGFYREAEARATASVERLRGLDAGGYLHGLTWRVAARFMLGDWEGALADQAELERVANLDWARDLPAAYTMRAYAYTALCHELRGEDEEPEDDE